MAKSKHPTKKPGRGRKVSEKQVRFSDTPKRPKPLTESRVRAIVREELGLIDQIKAERFKGPREEEVEELARVIYNGSYPDAHWSETFYKPEWRRSARAALKWFAERGSK